MPRGRRARPLTPALPAPLGRAVDRLRRLHRQDPAAALEKGGAAPDALSHLHARLAAERAAEGDAAGALAAARDAEGVPGGAPDATAAALLAAAEADLSAGEGAAAEALLLEAFERARSPLGAGVALARLALLYRDRSVPLGFRFYAPRALRLLDRGEALGAHPAADLDAARLACAVLEYHHRRDEPERSGRAFAVLDRVRDADRFTTVMGLKYHGLALGKLQEWEAAWKVFAEAARIAEEGDLRGCDGVFVYAAAVMVHDQEFAGARRLLRKVHIRRLEPAEKAIFRQFRHLVATAEEFRPLSGPKAEKFLRAQKRRERMAEKKAVEKAEEARAKAAARAAARAASLEAAEQPAAGGPSGDGRPSRKGARAAAGRGPAKKPARGAGKKRAKKKAAARRSAPKKRKARRGTAAGS